MHAPNTSHCFVQTTHETFVQQTLLPVTATGYLDEDHTFCLIVHFEGDVRGFLFTTWIGAVNGGCIESKGACFNY